MSKPSLLLLGCALALSARAEARELTVAYYGETMTHPGLRVGLDEALLSAGPLSLVGGLGAGGYVHYRYATALFVEGELGARLTTGFGLRFDLVAGAGYLHQVPFGRVYEVSPDGEIDRAGNLGRGAFRPAVSLGLGQELGDDLAVFARVQRFEEWPYNEGWLPHLALVVGFGVAL